MKTPQELAKEVLDSLEGCGDSCCITKKPKGMATNGGCRCHENKIKFRMNFYKIKKTLEEIAANEKNNSE